MRRTLYRAFPRFASLLLFAPNNIFRNEEENNAYAGKEEKQNLYEWSASSTAGPDVPLKHS
jgi:hypothetical protein